MVIFKFESDGVSVRQQWWAFLRIRGRRVAIGFGSSMTKAARMAQGGVQYQNARAVYRAKRWRASRLESVLAGGLERNGVILTRDLHPCFNDSAPERS